MENRLKLKISRMFRSSLGSCRSKNFSDVMEHPFFYPQKPHDHHHQLIQLFSPNPKPPRPFPSMCRPKSSQTLPEKNTHLLTRSKVTDRSSLHPFPAEKNGRNCPPASPISSLNTASKPKLRKSRKTRKKKSQLKKKKKFDVFFASVSGNYYGWWDTSSEDENENEGKDDDDLTTFFSSKSLSSDSTESFRRNRAKRGKGRIKREESEKGLMPLEGKVKDSFAVVKRSTDPYNDFRTSMVEMIVERQLFGSKDLENLLQCFLSLNSISHHRVIIEVFTEIWKTLFSEWA